MGSSTSKEHFPESPSLKRKKWSTPSTSTSKSEEFARMIEQHDVWRFFSLDDFKQIVMVSTRVFSKVAAFMERNFYFYSGLSNFSQPLYFNPCRLSPLLPRNLSLFQNYTHLLFNDSFQEQPYFPPSLIHLTFELNFYVQVPIPPNLLYLSIGAESKRLRPEFMNTLPPSLTSLTLKNLKNGSPSVFYISSLPPKLTHLHLLNPCKFSLSSPFPSSIKHVKTSSWINDPSFASSNVTHLTFLNNFDSTFVSYPPYFEHIPLHDNPLTLLPPSLTHLTFSSSFNRPLHSLPSSLLHLSIESYYFNQPVDDLPFSLSYLRIRATLFNQSISHLPPSLTSLIIASEMFCHPVESLPSLFHLELYFQRPRYPDPLPSSFTSICTLNESYSNQILRPTLQLGSLPSNLLSFVVFTPKPLLPFPSFPPNIGKLVFGNGYNNALPSLPKSLSTLILGLDFDQPINQILPLYLDQFAIRNYNYSHPFSLPPFLSRVRIGKASIEFPLMSGGPTLEYIIIRKKEGTSKWHADGRLSWSYDD